MLDSDVKELLDQLLILPTDLNAIEKLLQKNNTAKRFYQKQALHLRTLAGNKLPITKRNIFTGCFFFPKPPHCCDTLPHSAFSEVI